MVHFDGSTTLELWFRIHSGSHAFLFFIFWFANGKAGCKYICIKLEKIFHFPPLPMAPRLAFLCGSLRLLEASPDCRLWKGRQFRSCSGCKELIKGAECENFLLEDYWLEMNYELECILWDFGLQSLGQCCSTVATTTRHKDSSPRPPPFRHSAKHPIPTALSYA